MELQKTNQPANTSDEDYLKQLAQVNLLTSFPINDDYLRAWCKSIRELVPELTAQTLKIIIDQMKLGGLPYDSKKGIQNIIEGYKLILKDLIISRSQEANAIRNLDNPSDYRKELVVQLNLETERYRKTLDRISRNYRYRIESQS
jgi:hypothetical protein